MGRGSEFKVFWSYAHTNSKRQSDWLQFGWNESWETRSRVQGSRHTETGCSNKTTRSKAFKRIIKQEQKVRNGKLKQLLLILPRKWCCFLLLESNFSKIYFTDCHKLYTQHLQLRPKIFPAFGHLNVVLSQTDFTLYLFSYNVRCTSNIAINMHLSLWYIVKVWVLTILPCLCHTPSQCHIHTNRALDVKLQTAKWNGCMYSSISFNMILSHT